MKSLSSFILAWHLFEFFAQLHNYVMPTVVFSEYFLVGKRFSGNCSVSLYRFTTWLSQDGSKYFLFILTIFFFLFKETIESSRSRKQAQTSVYTQLVSISCFVFSLIVHLVWHFPCPTNINIILGCCAECCSFPAFSVMFPSWSDCYLSSNFYFYMGWELGTCWQVSMLVNKRVAN